MLPVKAKFEPKPDRLKTAGMMYANSAAKAKTRMIELFSMLISFRLCTESGA